MRTSCSSLHTRGQAGSVIPVQSENCLQAPLFYQLTGFVPWPRYLVTTGLGLRRVTAMWIIDSLMYNGLLVRISTGGLPDVFW